MAADAENWLVEQGLGKYCEVFRDNDVDMRALPHLTEDDLRELGLSLGHRRVFLAAVKAFQAPAVAERDAEIAVALTPEPEAAPDLRAKADSEAEFRHLSIAFVDMAGSTQLAETLEPEDMSDLLRRYQDRVTAEVERFGAMSPNIWATVFWPILAGPPPMRITRTGRCVRASRLSEAPRRALRENPLPMRFGSGLPRVRWWSAIWLVNRCAKITPWSGRWSTSPPACRPKRKATRSRCRTRRAT
ncbi:hypothetical protein CVM52_04230 [Pseudooceanicola lipolyticus]|uniref:SAM domain-containing protein n=1 Tax=Pseudooceanicola lipolyticus TaxID=2029104 RepID=A0A2M8J5D0_9RHOB|nr:hypothetical protein CVM52_04230 [Pseudooceanicola lipolyticus]